MRQAEWRLGWRYSKSCVSSVSVNKNRGSCKNAPRPFVPSPPDPPVSVLGVWTLCSYSISYSMSVFDSLSSILPWGDANDICYVARIDRLRRGR